MIVLEKTGKLWIRIRNWTPFLLFEKGSITYTRRWLRTVISRSNTFEDAVPWLHFFAIDWLTNYIKPSMKVFEWGSGGSTLFWSRHVQQVISVEHSRAWYERVLSALEERHIKHATLLCIPSDQEKNDTTDVQDFIDEATQEVFQKYANRINDYPDGEFDIILVDGKARLACLKNAVPKLRAGGVIVFDNSDRYPEALRWFDADHWLQLHFRGPTPYERTGSFFVTTLIINKVSDTQ